MRIKLTDLPPAYQAQAKRAIDDMDGQNARLLALVAAGRRVLTPDTFKGREDGKERETRGMRRREPNKTEAAYRDRVLAGRDARYEALTIRLANGHRYTPDWVVFEDGRPVECHEVKGAYRLGSYQRARMAFDQARVEWSGIKWVWGEQERGR